MLIYGLIKRSKFQRKQSNFHPAEDESGSENGGATETIGWGEGNGNKHDITAAHGWISLQRRGGWIYTGTGGA